MSFLKRIGSVRRKGTYNLSNDGADKKRSSQALSESAATRTPSALIQCHVTLLDDSSFTCEMNVSVLKGFVCRVNVKSKFFESCMTRHVTGVNSLCCHVWNDNL